MSVRHDVLNKLLDKYERSKLSKGGTKNNQKIRITSSDDLLSKYWSADSYLYRDKIILELNLLRDENLVNLEYKEELLQSVVLNIPNVSSAFSYLNRDSPNDKNQEIKEYAENELLVNTNKIVINFLKEILARLENYKSNTCYFKKLDELKDLIKILDGLATQKEKILLRNFSKKKLGDSKLFDRYASSILKIYNDFSNNHWESFEELCSIHNIYHNTKYALVKKGLVLQINNQIIDLDELSTELSLSEQAIDNLTIITAKYHKVITVENLTTFNYLNEVATIIYLGGFHNTVKRNLIEKIHSINPESEWYHSGDIDVNGFVILNDLRIKTGIPFKPLYMNIEQLEKYKNECQALTPNDKKRIYDMLDNPDYFEFQNVLKYMLENNVKLEQESIE